MPEESCLERNCPQVIAAFYFHNISKKGSNRAKDIKAQVLILHGLKDTAIPYQKAIRTADDIGIEKCKIRTWIEGGHGLVYDDPEGVWKCIAEFSD